MGKASKRKDRKEARTPPSGTAPAGFSPELTAKLQQGLSPEELTDPAILNQIVQAAHGYPAGSMLSFSAGGAPGTPSAAALPELAPGEAEAVLPRDGTFPLRPSQVIDLQVRIYERLARRDPWWLGFLGGFMEDALKRGVKDQQDAYDKWGVMFQPATSPEGYCGILARQLSMARTYQVTSAMVDVVTAMYRKTASTADSFQVEDIPWPAGFAYLDKPVSLNDRHGLEAKNRVLSWNLESARFRTDKPGTPLMPAVRIVCWSGAQPEDDDHYTDEVVREVTGRLGGLSLAHSVIVPFGQEYRTMTERRAEGDLADDVSRWLHALWLVMETEIPAMRRAADIERHVRHRALRSLNHADVTVVLLRRSASRGLDEGEPGHRHVDWTHRWVVQGFWRHHHKQHHHAAPDQSRESCAACGERISWVRPHLRGPSSLPLKQSPQLYRVAR